MRASEGGSPSGPGGEQEPVAASRTPECPARPEASTRTLPSLLQLAVRAIEPAQPSHDPHPTLEQPQELRQPEHRAGGCQERSARSPQTTHPTASWQIARRRLPEPAQKCFYRGTTGRPAPRQSRAARTGLEIELAGALSQQRGVAASALVARPGGTPLLRDETWLTGCTGCDNTPSRNRGRNWNLGDSRAEEPCSPALPALRTDALHHLTGRSPTGASRCGCVVRLLYFFILLSLRTSSVRGLSRSQCNCACARIAQRVVPGARTAWSWDRLSRLFRAVARAARTVSL